MYAARILIEARRLVERGWTKGCAARNKWRHPVNVQSKSAVKFCMLGAMEKANYNIMAMVYLKREIPPTYDLISDFNDARETSKEDVLGVFDQAIKQAENAS